MIAVFGAFKQEIDGLKDRMSISGVSSYKECRIYEGKFGKKPGILVVTGMGRKNAIEAAEYALNTHPVNIMISTGVCGGLNAKTTAGDFILCSTMKRIGGDENDVLTSDSGLLAIAENELKRKGCRYVVGTGISVPEVCSSPDSKREIAARYSSDAVDMESYWLGQAAAVKNIPFIVLRPVFDTAGDDMSPVVRIMPEGKLVVSKLIKMIFLYPPGIKKLINYRALSRRICGTLADFLMIYIENIPQGNNT